MANDRSTAPGKTTTKKAAPAKATARKTATAPAPRKAPAKAARKTAAPAAQAFPTLPPPGWYVDPADQTVQKWWDGEGWSGRAIPAGAPTPPSGPLVDEPDGEPAQDEATTATVAKPGSRPTSTITYRGRTMRVQMPSADQLAVWQRTATKLANATGLGVEETMKLIQRAITMIATVLVDEVDRDWVEESILHGDMDIMGAAAILTMAIEKLVAQAQTKAATAPRNGPVAKARARRR